MADSVSLQRDYSRLNECLIALYDGSGVKRTATVPYIDQQEMSDHIAAVDAALKQSGGLTANVVSTAHHSKGKGWGSSEGHTVGHPSQKLRDTIIPKDDEKAKDAIDAAQKLLNDVKKLLGDKEPTVLTAQGLLDLVKPTSGQGMNLLDFGALLQHLVNKPILAVARAHNGTKEGGHAPHLRAPGKAAAAAPAEGQETQETTQGEAPGAEQAPTAQAAAPEAPAAPAASTAAPQAHG